MLGVACQLAVSLMAIARDGVRWRGNLKLKAGTTELTGSHRHSISSSPCMLEKKTRFRVVAATAGKTTISSSSHEVLSPAGRQLSRPNRQAFHYWARVSLVSFVDQCIRGTLRLLRQIHGAASFLWMKVSLLFCILILLQLSQQSNLNILIPDSSSMVLSTKFRRSQRLKPEVSFVGSGVSIQVSWRT
jgi:hypothetical protein